MGITTGILLSYVVNVAFIDTKGGWRLVDLEEDPVR